MGRRLPFPHKGIGVFVGLVAGWTARLIDKKEYFIQTDIPRLPTQEGQQMSLFDFAAFQQPARTEGAAQPSVFPHPALPQQVIDEALCIGSNHKHSRLIICAYFKKDKPDNARFLAEHYGENGAGFYLNGKKYALWYNAEGIRIAEGESARRSSAALIPWEQAAARIRELLDLGRYMPQSELDQVDRYEVNALADRLLLMFRDIEDEDKRFFPSLRAVYDKPGGFPEAAEEIAGLLSREDGLQAILSEYEAFAAAYQGKTRLFCGSAFTVRLLSRPSLQIYSGSRCILPPPRGMTPSGVCISPQTRSTTFCAAENAA